MFYVLGRWKHPTHQPSLQTLISVVFYNTFFFKNLFIQHAANRYNFILSTTMNILDTGWQPDFTITII